MNIPIKILSKYGMGTLEDFKANMLENENEIMWYRQFLELTDHIPNKIIEKLIEDLASATALDFITIFIDFIKTVKVDYQEILSYRKLAREEINKLEAAR